MLFRSAYAALMREMNQPLNFPGGGRYINAASDSRLIAQAAYYVATNEIAANETYNVVNGDMLVWQDIWKSIAECFSMKVGGNVPLELTKVMPTHEEIWKKIQNKHDLQSLSLAQLIGSSWQFTDRALAYGLDTPANSVLSPIKLHQHGFHGCMDTEDSFIYWIERMQKNRLLPY